MTEPRTVLFVQHYADGGSVLSLFELVRSLDPARYRPLVAFRTTNPFVAEFEAAGIEVVCLSDGLAAPERLTPALGRRDPTSGRSTSLRREVRRLLNRDLPTTRRLLALARSRPIDLVHANNDLRVNRDAVAVAAALRVPLVVHVRWIYTPIRDVSWWVDRQLARKVDHAFFISDAARDAYGDLGIAPERTEVLDNPFELGPAPAEVGPAGLVAELGLPAGAPVVVLVGRITPWKGQHVLLGAAGRLAGSVPDLQVVLVGAPTDALGKGYQEELEQLAGELGITHRVHLTGARRDVAEVLAAADVVVHASTQPEPFGRVVVEAMAAGRPLVAADAGGVPEVVDDGQTGLLVAPGDEAELARAIEQLLADPAEAAAMGRRARLAAEARFGTEAHAQAVQAAYDRVLDPPARSRRTRGRRARAAGRAGAAGPGHRRELRLRQRRRHRHGPGGGGSGSPAPPRRRGRGGGCLPGRAGRPWPGRGPSRLGRRLAVLEQGGAALAAALPGRDAHRLPALPLAPGLVPPRPPGSAGQPRGRRLDPTRRSGGPGGARRPGCRARRLAPAWSGSPTWCSWPPPAAPRWSRWARASARSRTRPWPPPPRRPSTTCRASASASAGGRCRPWPRWASLRTGGR
ncbi:glycosyltransferase family 4 protein [Aquihabitans sp. G128]|nr:glycosyltransferase family 4 protein [Aquihabitans sp. G128]